MSRNNEILKYAAIGAGVGVGLAGAALLYRAIAPSAAAGGAGCGSRAVVKATPSSSLPLHKLQSGETSDTEKLRFTAPASAENLPVFSVTTKNGFLPLVKPLRKLPAEFAALDAVMARLPELLHSADENALATAVAGIPQYAIDAAKLTPVEAQSLYRDLSILVSAYLLEGKTKAGKARAVVPANIAVPFTALAKALDQNWIMSYDSYCLSNAYSLSEPATAQHAYVTAGGPAGSAKGALAEYHPSNGHFAWDALRLARSFDGGAEECTFVTIHAEIESHTPALISAYADILAGLRAGSVPAVKAGLTALREVQEGIVVSQLKMFNASDPRNYEKWVRPWIFGWANSEDHPGGVVFEGVQAEATFLRGETGAQSTIVPSLDLMLGVTHKSDTLRAFLVELESYRPKPHREFLRALRTAMWGYDVGPGGAPSEATGDAPAAAAGAAARARAGVSTRDAVAAAAAAAPSDPKVPDFGPNPLSSPSRPSAGVAVPHALRDFVRLSGDGELATIFNACVGLIWCFRDIHVTFSGLYIGRFSKRETATGGTPYRAYLRKHRDESMAHQVTEFGPAALKHYFLPSLPEYSAELDGVLTDSAVNGIPPHLLVRHADIIAKHGRGSLGLARKAFPSGPEFVHHDVASGGAGGR